MGTSSSSNSVQSPTSECGTAASSRTKNVQFANDEGRQRAHVGTRVHVEEDDQSRLQSQNSCATSRADEFCNQRLAASSLLNVVPPKRETLLTYAAQMTGWQSADGHDPPTCQQNNEVMELSRIISQLAVANQQLASTHCATLARVDALYVELFKKRDDARRAEVSAEAALEIRDDNLRKRLRSAERDVEREEARRLEQRVDRLETLLEAASARHCEQRNPSEGELHSRIERLENLSRTKETESDGDSRPDVWRCETSGRRTSRVDEAAEDRDVAVGRGADSRERRSVRRDDAETNVPMLNEKRSTNVDLDRRRTQLVDDGRGPIKNLTGEEIVRLSEEVARLRAERLECQSASERLLGSLANEKDLVKRLSEDYEELKARRATAEANLRERREQCDELTKDLDSAKGEIERLLREIDVSQSEKDTAEARIATLERDLRKALLENEQIKNAENQNTSKLRAQLSEEVLDKKKQIEALEDALREIQRLKETVKTERRGESTASEEGIDIDLMDDVSEGTSNPHSAAVDMEQFKRELALKREARHRAIATVSSEMERLRRELDTEREAHSKTSSMLALLRSARDDLQKYDFATDDLARSTTREREEQRERSDESERMSRRAEAQRLTNTLKVSDALRNDVRYQIEKVDDLRYHLETDAERHRHRIRCLTEATNKASESLGARERQTNELKNYLAQILVRLGDRSFLEVRDEAGAECCRQLENINALKGLYNERLRVLTELRESAVKELTDAKQRLEYSLKKSESLEEEFRKAEEKVDVQASEIANLESQLGLTKADCRDLQNQMSLINGLFTQMLLGATSADIDLDRLTQLLQENHDLISGIAREESTEAAALPKLLLDLIEQVEGSGRASQRHANGESNAESGGDVDRKEDDLQEEDIAHNLPKVWRVLLELLSCHAVTSPSVSVASCSDPNSCYKSVDTPAGPQLVISVSKTYIRLKELILEKKHLEKEMNRMKQLNVHLESKLGEQEKRLSMVSAELTKTWDIVGRMQAQHQQLHTHEEILRYELQEKRKMLQELKQELEYCREKWESARQKNTNTELEWRNLRREFAARKALAVHDSFCSAESGFSDERGDDTDEEDDSIEGRIRHGPRRRARKESPRVPTPDTESEQPTDTELSESKTGSSAVLEQRTPTPETETELDEIEVADLVDSEVANATEVDPTAEISQEPLDPLDQALTNVIQDLIRLDNGESSESLSILREDTVFSGDSRDNLAREFSGDTTNDGVTTSEASFCGKSSRQWTPIVEPWCTSPTPKTLKRIATNIDLPTAVNNGKSTESSSTLAEESGRCGNDDDTIKSENISPVSRAPVAITAAASNTTSVFSIGPLPASAMPLSITKSDRAIVACPFAPVFGATELENNSTSNSVASTSTVRSLSISSARQEKEPTESKEQRFSRPVETITDSDNISVDSSSSLDTVREFPTTDVGLTSSFTLSSKEEPRESATNPQKEATITSSKSRTSEEVLAARADRLRRLEEQADWLVKKMNATSKRGSALCIRLEELHETYGEPPIPPPMPDVLPSCKLPSSLPDLPRQVEKRSYPVNRGEPSSRSDPRENIAGESSDAAKDDNIDAP